MRHILSKLAAASLLVPASALATQAAPPSAQAVEPVELPAAEVPGETAPAQVAPEQHLLPPSPVRELGSPVITPVEPVAQIPLWQVADAEELLAYVEQVGVLGLDPADYDHSALAAALGADDYAALSIAATQLFEALARDLALGHVPAAGRVDWHIVDTDFAEKGSLRAYLAQAIASGSITQSLDQLAPTHPQYAALVNALAAERAKGAQADADKIADIRLNLDRWRWLPRDLGNRYIIVNVPAYTAALVEDGVTKSRHRAVAGAKATPTPQLMAEATGVIFNPYWNVPKSIEPEIRGKAGYEAVKADDGSIIRWRQPPGPTNALGRVKFVMYNPHLIYLHDTNARGLFDTEARAYSHGCIRTENILGLATMLLEEDGGDWSAQKTVDVVNSGENTGAKFVRPIPVYIVYMSVAARGDGSILAYEDIYDRDAPVLQALNDAPAVPGAEEIEQAADPLAPLEGEEVASAE
ncbi:L,D-transpeptidase family protein [Sphingomicrobium astaxanthinifaciens]|uniref:L,D-transpeptidase family protein n=1 Tax=Sphingomicrobium astaxanthinifaciens TaxID=1227949 RepID=UPI001FCC3B1F|nr:L,D-transpeptidase family protein [Sphingomicrobium astaxanthinifaciens]MCJ7421004.1 L,D-transpeptidase family protein [Sphingomicrobium astaxanthinifaciens]